MKHLIALLIKDKIQPKFCLIKDLDNPEHYKKVIKMSKLKEKDIQATVYMGEGLIDPTYMKGLINDNGELVLEKDFEQRLVSEKIRIHRNRFLEDLDKEYLKAFSMNDKKALNRVEAHKTFLKDLTKKPLIKDNKLICLFYNISDLIIEDPGEGYDSPPKISIDPPSSKNASPYIKMMLGGEGEQAEAVCAIKAGKIDSIIMKNWGSGYYSMPNVSVTSPTAKNSRVAKLVPLISYIVEESR